MTKREAIEEMKALRKIVKDWLADDPWHEAVIDRYEDLFSYVFCCNGRDPGPWEVPPVPEGVVP